MADDCDASSSAAHPPVPVNPHNPLTEDDLRSLYPDEQGWVHGYWARVGHSIETLVQMGSLNKPEVLESLLAAGRWLKTEEFLQGALIFHRAEAEAAVAYPADASPFDLLRAHPELFVLLRRQRALELWGQGKQEEAEQYYREHIVAPTRLARRTTHLNTTLTELGNILARAGPHHRQLLNLPHERRETARHIHEYMRVYFPRFAREPEHVEAPSKSNKTLHNTAPFVEMLREKNQYRCLVCHRTFTFADHDVNNRFVQHLHYHCTAVTPAVRRRLPRRNLPPFRVQAAAAAEAAAAADDEDVDASGTDDDDVAPD